MEYVYGAMLLHKAGKEINKGNLEAVMKGAGIKVDITKVNALIEALKDINIDEVIKEASVAQTVVTAQADKSTKAEEKEKPEEKEKSKEEAQASASAGLGALFG